MVPDFLEILVKWSTEPREPSARWFRDRGFLVQPVRVGLLVSAARSTVEAVFATRLESASLPFELPLPDDLAPSVASLTVLQPRAYRT